MVSFDFVIAMFMKNIAYETKSLVVQLQTIEVNILDIHTEKYNNIRHRPRNAPRHIDEHAGNAEVLSLEQFYQKQLRKILHSLIHDGQTFSTALEEYFTTAEVP